MRFFKKYSILFFMWFCIEPFSVNAQDQSALEERQEEALRIFIDCPDYPCDLDYFRTEITFVNYVRDRTDAHVHILITTQRTGGGGREFTVSFIGQKQFTGIDDTLRYISRQTDTEDDIRRGLVRTLKIGLMRYVAHSPVGDRIEVSYVSPKEKEAGPQVVKDPWNFWTFRYSLRGSANGEKSVKSLWVNSSFSANRTTEEWKIRLSLTGGYSESKYKIDDVFTITNIQRNYGLRGLVVKSLGRHWSVGARGSASYSTYKNYDLALRLAPALEYNIFPYAEATRRLLTFQYLVGVNDFNYHEETIFLKNSETLFDHTLSISYDIKQPWGSISTSLEGSNYLHDFNKFHLELFSSLEVRLFKGLSLNLFGWITFLRDQLSLPRRGASLQEVLLRQRQLATSYNYYFSLGISYTFGSIYSNIVNPRFGGTGGGRVFYFY